MTALRETPLAATHRALGARMVEFGGFLMPVQYASILAEHAAVRERAGIFDVSHMGEIHLSGAGAVAAAERLVTCPVASLAVGAVRYGCLCNEAGGTVDDIVKVNFWMKDPATDRKALNGEWAAMFPDAESRPARHTLSLPPDAAAHVTCDFVAVIGG